MYNYSIFVFFKKNNIKIINQHTMVVLVWQYGYMYRELQKLEFY